MKHIAVRIFGILSIGLSALSFAAERAVVPIPVFPNKAWSEYLIQTGFAKIPSLFGFAPNYEGSALQKIPLVKNTIPVLIKCRQVEGCDKYAVYGDTSTVRIVYSKDSSSGLKRSLSLSSVSGAQVNNAITYVYVPKDAKDHDDVSFELSGSKHFFYGGHLESLNLSFIRRLVTNRDDIMAIVYINQESLKDPQVRMVYTSQSGEQYQFRNEYQQQTGLLTENAYNLSGIVWQHIDSTTLAPGSSWNKQESLQSGTTETKTKSMAIGVGVPFNPLVPYLSQVSPSFQRTWGESFTISQSKSVSTTVSCQNPRDSDALLVCGFYQAYGATRLVAPGLYSNRYNIFAEFNRMAQYSNEVILSIGDSTFDSVSEDGDILGIIYPLAGTVYPEDALITGVPTHLMMNRELL